MVNSDTNIHHNVVNADTFNDDIHVFSFFPFVNIALLNEAGNLVVLSVDKQSNRTKFGFNAVIEFVVFWVLFALTSINDIRALTLLVPS